MRIKTGDKVKIISGKDKGKTGKVSQILHSEEKIVVEGVNKMVKHLKKQRTNDKGQKIEFFAPVHTSNALIICPKCSKTTRVAIKKLEDGSKERLCKKCQASLDTAQAKVKDKKAKR